MKKFKISRKFIMAITTILVIGLNRAFGWELTEQDVEGILFAALGFMGAEGIADAAGAFKNGGKPQPPTGGAT